MKKVISMLLVAIMALVGTCALSEEIKGAFEDGNYVIRIPAADQGWEADDLAQDGSVLRLVSAETVDGVFTAAYAPVADGEMTISVKHMDGIACDQALTFDLKVTGDAIESVGGSHTEAPAEEELDAVISGDWQINDNIMAGMTIEKNPDKGWSLQIATAYPDVHVMQANMFYDCELDEFVYDDGTFYESEITNSPEVVIGDEVAKDVYGTITLAPQADGAIHLIWYNALNPEETAEFYRPEDDEAAAAPANEAIIDRFSDTWVADGYTAEIWYDAEEGGFNCDMVIGDSFAEYRDCHYDEAADALVCEGGIRYYATFNANTGDYDQDVVSDFLTAVFTVADDKLTCEDSEGQVNGVVFLRLDDAEEADMNALYEGSEIYTQGDVEDAMIAVEDAFSQWEGCEMHDIRYAGDGCATEEKLQWMNELGGKEYAQCIEILTDFHSPVEGGGAWEADKDYADYEWWLAREEGGNWELLSWGY